MDNTKKWEITPLRVRVFNKERMMPRSGASIDLSKKSILLIGCGSVGGEIAYKLGATGIGRLSMYDPDLYSLDNLYRHVLEPGFQGFNKAQALSFQLKAKYPWIQSEYGTDKLLNLKKKTLLSPFDLIIIAIESPTHERIFHDYLINNEIQTPVINTWLEGYGVGGHATLDIPDSKGCLRCAYVDNNTLTRGLSSI
ncbi:MAG: ThiF family adenylyltransferase [Cocleimonas sp.]